MSAIYQSEIWLKSYDPHVGNSFPKETRTLADRTEEVRRQYGDRVAYQFMGARQTYDQMLDHVDRVAACLAAHGLAKGDVVGVAMPNSPQYLITVLGALKAGCVITGISPLLTASEMLHQLRDSGAKALVILDALFEEKLAGIADQVPDLKLVIPSNITDYMPGLKRVLGKALKKVPIGRITPLSGKEVLPFRKMLARFKGVVAPRAHLEQSDPAFIQYTGGTTGLPKGAVLTHGSVSSNLQQMTVWLEIKRGQEIFISGFPMFHIAGLFTALLAMLNGCRQALIPDPRNTGHICLEIEALKPTFMANVPSLWLLLLQDPAFAKQDFSRLEVCITAAAPMPVEGLRALEAVIGEGSVCELMGMTETSPVICLNPRNGAKKPGSAGLPIVGTKVRLMDLATGEEDVPLGQEGEMVITGPQLMAGYHGKPEETKAAMREHDGEIWMHTGDVAIMDDDGYLFIVDRTKDMVNISGYKVFPRELEEKLFEHPLVEMCAVVGMTDPDRLGNEMVKLVVQRNDKFNGRSEEEIGRELIAYIKERVAPYKVPKVVEFVDAIPLTSVGKVDKKAMRV